MEENKTIVKRYKRVSDNINAIVESKNKTSERGRFMGLQSLQPYISFITGACTTIYGQAGSGKTQFCIQCVIDQAMKYGSKTVMLLTEAGDLQETYIDIAQTYLRKRVDFMTDEELLTALHWMDEYIFLIDLSKGLLSIRDIFEQVLMLQKDYKVKIDNVVLDHFGNILPDPSVKGLNVAESVKFTFQAITATAKAKDWHIMILFHTASKEPTKCPVTQKYYMTKSEPYELSGGVQSHFLSQQMISVHRYVTREDQYGIINPDTQVPYELDETHITCTKVKPKMSGKLGNVVIRFDWKSQSYFETIDGVPSYSWGYEGGNKEKTGAMKPNLDFGKDLENPF